jgi:hypothetical protein
MPERIQKSKFTLHYNIGFVFIALLFIYVFYSNREDFAKIINANYLLLLFAGLFAGIHAFQIDRLRRTKDQSAYVNFWKYLDDTNFWVLGNDFWKILPLLKRYSEPQSKKIKYTVNILTFLIYGCLLGFIWTLK